MAEWEDAPAVRPQSEWESAPVRRGVMEVPSEFGPPVTQREVQPSRVTPFTGAAEAATTLGSGLVAGAVAPLYGVGREIAAGKFGTPAGTRYAEEQAERAQQALTYQPRTATGQAMVGGIAKGMEALGGPALLGVAPELEGLAKLGAPATQQAAAAAKRGAGVVKRGVGEAIEAVTDPIGAAIAKRTVGLTQPEITQLANKAEQLGFRLEARQLQPDAPLGTPGFSLRDKEHNENLASELASSATGRATTDITPAFLEERQKSIGKEIDQIYNRNFQLDKSGVDALRQIAAFERRVFPAGQGDVTATASNLVNRWLKAVEEAERQKIEKQIQKMMGGRKGQPLQPGIGGGPPPQAWRDWPSLRTVGGENLPSWFNDVNNVVEDLRKNLGIPDNVISVWTSEPRRQGLYGQAWGTGHIIIRSDLDAAGALDTALHELGHQMEFQQFVKAPREEQNAVIAAWREQHRNIPTGQKTTEFYRPVTSAKYPEAGRTAVVSGSYESYLRNFAEWWAEQTSRWFTQTKAPVTLAEKFFKGVADRWRSIYAKAKEYLPMVPEVETYYKSRWNNPMITGAVAQPEGVAAERAFASLGEDVTATIPGAELQRLRSNLAKVARTATDGNDRFAASQFITALDEALMKDNPELLERLKKANRQYTATMTLADGIEQGWVSQGKVDLSRLGQYVAGKSYGYGTGTSRHPLYDLGYMGRALNMRSRVAGAQYPQYGTERALIGRTRQALVNALKRPGPMRALQRRYSEQALRRRNQNP